MSLFQNSVLNKYLKGLESEKVNVAYDRFKSHFHNPAIQLPIYFELISLPSTLEFDHVQEFQVSVDREKPGASHPVMPSHHQILDFASFSTLTPNNQL